MFRILLRQEILDSRHLVGVLLFLLLQRERQDKRTTVILHGISCDEAKPAEEQLTEAIVGMSLVPKLVLVDIAVRQDATQDGSVDG